jgi:hypothetical protein
MSLTKYVLGSFAVAGGLVYHAMVGGFDTTLSPRTFAVNTKR